MARDKAVAKRGVLGTLLAIGPGRRAGRPHATPVLIRRELPGGCEIADNGGAVTATPPP
jgi:hypothetical protein